MTTVPHVRDAHLDDAAAIAAIHVGCWRHAYAELVPRALLDSLDVEQRTEQWRARIGGAGEPRGATLVSVDAADVVTGFAQVGPSAGDDARLGALFAIYLAPATIGTGVGRVLLEAATERLREAGYTRACLDVLPGNVRARRVYEAAGWHADGEPWIVIHGQHELLHQRYVRPL